MSMLFFSSIILFTGLVSFVKAQNINPPTSSVELMRVNGAGTYNYICQNSVWVYVDYSGDLFQQNGNSVKVGSFWVTPTPDENGGRNLFQINGSTVMFKTNTTEFTRTSGSIPDVLYSATSTTSGTLEKVTFGQGLNGSGGGAPSNSCNNQDETKVPFQQTYVFYIPSANNGYYYSAPTVTNYNQFTGALLGVPPVKITNIQGQTQPWQVINYDGSVAGAFNTRLDATRTACGIQRDQCSRIASDSGYQQGVKVQDCFDQYTRCVASQATAV